VRDRGEDLTSAVDRLFREVVNLRRDTGRLYARVDPEWNGQEPGYLAAPELDPLYSLTRGAPKPPDEKAAWQLIKSCRDLLHGADFHLGAIRAHMDDICKDAISREEMKPYLKDR